jgi:hypothetical protein
MGRFTIPCRVFCTDTIAATESRLATKIAETSTRAKHAINSIWVLLVKVLSLMGRGSISTQKGHITCSRGRIAGPSSMVQLVRE